MDVAVVIPAWNEEEPLPKVLAALPPGLRRVVVVDNGSTDGTAAAARAGGAELVPEPRRGYGSACLAGLAALAADPPEVVVFLDADFSDSPGELPLLLEPIAAGRADLVIGSRAAGKAAPRALLPQARFGNWLATRIIRLLTGARFTDLGPFRAIRYETLTALGMRDTGFGWTVEMQMKAGQRRIRSVEVPVSYKPRIGRSKITGTVSGTLRAGTKILWTIGSLWLAGGPGRGG